MSEKSTWAEWFGVSEIESHFPTACDSGEKERKEKN